MDNVWFQEIPILPCGKLLEIPKGRGSLKPDFLKESTKLYWNFQRGVFKSKTSHVGLEYEYFLEEHNLSLL